MNNNVEHTQFGVHFMLDGYGADQAVLADQEALTKLLQTLPEQMGMHKLNEPLVVEVPEKNPKDPGGYSGFVMIAESHISFHTFPKREFVTLDVYSCQNDLDTDKLTRRFTDFFKLKDTEIYIQKRGTKYPANNVD